MKKNLKLFFVLFLATVQSQNIAFVNEKKLLKSIEGYEKAIKETDSIYKNNIEEINNSNNKLNDKVNLLFASYNFTKDVSYEEIMKKLTDTDKKKFELLQEESQLINKQKAIKEADYQSFYQEKVGKILEKSNKIVQEYCKKNKIDALFKIDVLQSALGFYDEKKDITEILLKLIK
jgi:Skp family chaperone for outer membrane proteins